MSPRSKSARAVASVALALVLTTSHAAEADEPIDVTVRAPSKARALRESARPIEVIELERDRRTTADMGQVLARSEGISVRRTGALGADARLSLNGLTDEQVRVFIDGVPLELAGYPFGVNNVPLELVKRIEVHRGVVPMRLGADSLGGAVELTSDEDMRGTHGHASYQAGSFDTHRLLASGRRYDAATGLFVRAEGFFDKTENDYRIRVPVPDRRGYRLGTAHRHNDDYRAGFASVEAGFVHRPWARKLLVRAFFGDMDKGIPSDPQNLNYYGEVRAERRVSGVVARFESVPMLGFQLSAIAGYNARDNVLRDLSSCAFDADGRCVFDRAPARGERERASDQHVTQESGLGRLTISRALAEGHTLRLSTSPTFTRRTGENRALAPGENDDLAGRRDLLTIVSGLEYQADLFDDRLQNLVFAKHYAMRAESKELQPSTGVFAPIDSRHQRPGFGDALRFRFTDWLYGKASYEWATRLPTPDQLFGDVVRLIDATQTLAPESAHNVNLGGGLDLPTASAGTFRGQSTFFARRVDDLIWLFVGPSSLKYRNVGRATSLGIEGSLGWTSPGRWVALDGNATYQAFRNRSPRPRDEGSASLTLEEDFGRHRGARIPNQPYLFANGALQVFARGLVPDEDELSLTWRTSYVHGYFVGWEDVTSDALKKRVPAQLIHGIGLTLLLRKNKTTISTSIDVHNLTDARIYDYFGVQLPGRSVAAKLTLGI